MDNIVQQISGKDHKGRFILSLIAKRTYAINSDGTCTLSNEQTPLSQDIKFHNEFPEIIAQDSDLYHYKPFTDIIIKGKARSAKKTNSFIASVQLAKLNLNLNIIGNRKAYLNKSNKIVFSEAETISEIPLEYNHAYGGKDLLAEKPLREKLENDDSLKFTKDILNLLEGSPYRYPRNPSGKGYIIEPTNEAIENLELPNIENQEQLLTSDNLICKRVEEWYKMPVPIGTNWVSPGWFPRVGYYGLYQLPKNIDDSLYEIKKGWSDLNLLNSKFRIKEAQFNFRFCNGASLGLQSKHLVGGEHCMLINIHPKKQEFVIKLPSDRPEMKVDGRNGKLLKVNPRIQTVIIEPETNKLSIIWSGNGKAKRPYFKEELKTMPYYIKWN